MEKSLDFGRICRKWIFSMQRNEKAAVSLLNEMMQKHLLREVTYDFEQTGVVHLPTFHCACRGVDTAGAIWIGTGEGKTKKEAGANAASEIVVILKQPDQEGV